MVYRTSQNGALRINTEKWQLFLNILKILSFNYNLEKYFGNFRVFINIKFYKIIVTIFIIKASYSIIHNFFIIHIFD